MTWYRVGLACLVSVALVACKDNPQGVLQPQTPLAGLRYVNLVNDTGAVDFRIVNFIGDAPSAGAAAFRTGGSPNGVATTFLPNFSPVEAGRDVEVRVFMNGLDPVVASQVVYDTTVNLTAGVNYSFWLYGSARTSAVHSLVTADTLAAPAGLAFRVIHLGGAAVGNVDVDIVARTGTAPLAGTATFANVAPGTVTAYTAVAVPGAGVTLKAVMTAPATRSPFLVTTFAPAGVVGTATANPVGGTAVAGTTLSAIIVPASVTGSPAPQTGNPAAKSTQSVTRSRDSVLVLTGWTTTVKNRVKAATFDTTYQVHTGNAAIDTIIKFRRVADTSLAAVGNTHGFAVGDLTVVSGATDAAYNGWHYVMQVADTTICLPPDSIRDFRRTCSRLAADTLRVLIGDTLFATVDTVAGVAKAGTVPVARSYTSTVQSRFRYRIGVTTPVTPAAGTLVYRAYPAGNQPNPSLSNYTIPWILFVIDRQPSLTAP
ncbi:MAG: hypothetical protein ABSB58_01685 [Gemmatimonadales bacterium]|jgi:hypothetical protein